MSTDLKKLQNYYDFALKLVIKCGDVMRRGYEKHEPNFAVKNNFYDLVTVYDKQIEDILINGLRDAFPESQFIAEEEASESKREPILTDAATWIIDPIDGTTNFINKIPHCCISVGLAINKELVAGIVYNSIANELYSAYKGHGAFLNGQQIHVNKCETISQSVVGYEISMIQAAKLLDKNVRRLATLGSHSRGIRCMGSAALTLCYVASGSFQCYHVEDLMPWDIAAGAVILREAGGVIYHTKGGEFDIMHPDLVCAVSEALAKEVMSYINEADQLPKFTFK